MHQLISLASFQMQLHASQPVWAAARLFRTTLKTAHASAAEFNSIIVASRFPWMTFVCIRLHQPHTRQILKLPWTGCVGTMDCRYVPASAESVELKWNFSGIWCPKMVFGLVQKKSKLFRESLSQRQNRSTPTIPIPDLFPIPDLLGPNPVQKK